MRLNQISAGDALTGKVVAAMMKVASLLGFVEFYSLVGNADYARKAATATGGKFRALDEDYAANQVTPQFANPTLTIFGDQVQVDRAHERRGADIPSVRATELLNFAKNLGKQFQYYFINGDSGADAKQFDGLKTMITAAHKVSGVPTNGLTVVLGNDSAAKTVQQQFLELIDELIGMVDGGADALIMDVKTRSRLTTIAREFVQMRPNEFGVPIPYYNEIPLIAAGYDAAGNKTIGHNETYGTNTSTTSIYAAKFGEKSDLTVATNVGVEVKDLGLVGVHYTHSVDLDVDLALLNDKAIAVLPGIEIATS